MKLMIYTAIFVFVVALGLAGLTSIVPVPVPAAAACHEPMSTFCKNLVPADVEDMDD